LYKIKQQVLEVARNSSYTMGAVAQQLCTHTYSLGMAVYGGVFMENMQHILMQNVAKYAKFSRLCSIWGITKICSANDKCDIIGLYPLHMIC